MIDDDHLDEFNEKYRIKSGRLEDWDYASPWWYFVTICTVHHGIYFGRIIDGKLLLSKQGEILNRSLVGINKKFDFVYLSDFVIMPNHVHLLIKFKYQHIPFLSRDGINAVSNKNIPIGFRDKRNLMTENGLPKVIRWLKGITTFQIRRETKIVFGWQSRYYDEIIKSEGQFWATKRYIQDNVKNWKKDKSNI